VIGFGGRALQEEQLPKYVNSPQTPLFDKSRALYGIDLAKDAIRTEERAVLVEGYMDVLAAHQAGWTNVVASMGTALTSEQIRLLNRYSPNLVLALDADEAGQRAAERGLEAILHAQRQVRQARWERARQGQGKASDVQGDMRVLTLPEGYDPDDLFREAPERWKQLVDDAQPVVDYLINHRLRNVQIDDATQKARAASDLLPVLAEIDSTLVRDHYLQRLARLLRTDERLLAQELVEYLAQRRSTRPARAGTPPEPPPPLPPDAPDDGPPPDDLVWADEELANGLPVEGEETARSDLNHLEAYLLYLIVERPSLVGKARQEAIRPDMWEGTGHRQLFEALLAHTPESAAHLEEFLEELELSLARQLRRIVDFYTLRPTVPEDEWEEEGERKLHELIIRFYERQARHLHYMIEDTQRAEETDAGLIRALQQQQTAVERSRLHHQRLLRERARRRKIPEPNQP
ncbi:MAG: DNA primase, partial [Ardenticatenaceae bacterium]